MALSRDNSPAGHLAGLRVVLMALLKGDLLGIQMAGYLERQTVVKLAVPWAVR